MYMQPNSGQAKGQPQEILRETTIRAFDGGLNVIDTDLNMSPKYAKVLDNIERATDGSLALRPGTKLMVALPDTSDVVNHTYFVNYVITVQESGAWNRVAADGTNTVMTLVPGGGTPWPTGVDYTSFTVFNSDLIAVNGRDKPILVKGNPIDPNYLEAQLLVDEATGTNVNTPIGKYVIAHGQYTIIAGVPTDPSKIFISARGTSGTYVGDPPPNDAVTVDLGPRVSLGSAIITGMVAYRDKLLVCFERGVLPVNLGVYTGSPSVHTPTDDGFIEEFGCLAHRSLVSVGDDTFFNDNVGINSINRVNMFNTLRPIRASHLVDPLTTAAIQPLTRAQIQKYVFAVYDLRNFRYMVFVPIFDSGGVLQETVGFSYTNIPTLKIQAWARLRGWKWQSACRTALQNVIFSMGNKLYAYDFDNFDANADFIGDTTQSADGKGVPINFDWELPWADMKQRMKVKATRYLAFDTQGTAVFTVEGYADNLQYRQGVTTPLLKMDFVAGDSGGYGNQPYGNSPYGGGRRTQDERLYAWVMKYKLMKLRVFGSTRLPLRFISISISYVLGGIRR